MSQTSRSSSAAASNQEMTEMLQNIFEELRDIKKKYARLSSKLPEDGLLRFKEFEPFLPVRKSAWWAGVKEGIYPQPVRFGRTVAWRAQDIRRLIDHGVEATQ